MATRNITNYNLKQIEQEFFSTPGKSYNFNGLHFKSARQMYDWIQDRKKEYSNKGEKVRITFDPETTKSFAKTTTQTTKTTRLKKVKPKDKGATNFKSNNPQDIDTKTNFTSDDSYFNYKGRTNWGSLFGPERWKGVQYAWQNNPEEMQRWKSASDDVGNTIITIAGLPTMAGVAGNMFNAIKTGAYGSLLGGLTGSYAGSSLGDAAVRQLSDNKYGSTYDFLRLNGFSPINSVLMDAPAWLGGWGGSKLGSGILNNLITSLENTIPREVYVEGSSEPIKQYAGESITVERPNTTQMGGSSQGYRYTGLMTNPRGVGRGGGVRSKGHTVASGGRSGKTTRVSLVPVSETGVRSGKGTTMTIETPVAEYAPLDKPITFFYPGPSVPPPIVPTPEPKPETRFEKIDYVEDPFTTWYKTLKEGRTEYFPGHENSTHTAGWYKIHRVNADIPSERRLVATGFGDTRGENKIVSDSTSFSRAKVIKDNKGNFRVLVGGVDPDAKVSNEYLLTPEEIEEARKQYLGLKKKGGLIKRNKQYSF